MKISVRQCKTSVKLTKQHSFRFKSNSSYICNPFQGACRATKMSTRWQHGLFDCMDSFDKCVVSLICPCYQFGKNAAELGENNIACCVVTFVPGLLPCSAAHLRSQLRQKRGIRGSYGKDLATWIFCPLCALVQETLEHGAKTPNDISIDRT